MIPQYPNDDELHLAMRPFLHLLFQKLPDGISEFTFANLYLFRDTHKYKVSMLEDGLLLICGEDDGSPFFMLPFGWPNEKILGQLFAQFGTMKCISENQVQHLEALGYEVTEDRDNFDYLYSRKDLAELAGRKFHKKRNLIKAFLNNYAYEARPLLETYINDALGILEKWRANRDQPGDYQAAKEALEMAPNFPMAYHGIGLVYMAMGKYEDAAEAFEMAVEKAPNEAPIYLDLGKAYKMQHEYNKAYETFKKAAAMAQDAKLKAQAEAEAEKIWNR